MSRVECKLLEALNKAATKIPTFHIVTGRRYISQDISFSDVKFEMIQGELPTVGTLLNLKGGVFQPNVNYDSETIRFHPIVQLL